HMSAVTSSPSTAACELSHAVESAVQLLDGGSEPIDDPFQRSDVPLSSCELASKIAILRDEFLHHGLDGDRPADSSVVWTDVCSEIFDDLLLRCQPPWLSAGAPIDRSE